MSFIVSSGFVAFGLWWVLAPRSVMSFYRIFLRGRVALPQPAGIRIAGLIWLALFGVIILSHLHTGLSNT